MTGVIAFPIVAALWIALWRATRPTPPRTVAPPYDWAQEDDQRDVDLEFCKVWATEFPKDYEANWRTQR